MSEKHFIKPEDIFKISSVTDPRFSPSGEEALFVRTETLEKENNYASNLYHWDRKTDAVKQWTFGKNRVSGIQWASNGEYFLFISNRDEKNQVYVMSSEGGEAKQVTTEENGVNQAFFSPDSKKIIYHVSVKKEENEANDEDEENKDDKKERNDFPQPKVID